MGPSFVLIFSTAKEHIKSYATIGRISAFGVPLGWLLLQDDSKFAPPWWGHPVAILVGFLLSLVAVSMTRSMDPPTQRLAWRKFVQSFWRTLPWGALTAVLVMLIYYGLIYYDAS